MKFRFGKEDIFMIFLNLLVIGFGVYYCRKLIVEDFNGIYWIVLIVLSAIMILSDLFTMGYSGKLPYLLFMAAIGFFCYKAYNLNEADNKKMDPVFFELATNGGPYPDYLDEELSLKGPKFGSHSSWFYKKVGQSGFAIFRLDKMNLLRREYPDDKGWVSVLQNDIAQQVLLQRKLSESEKEREVARRLSELSLTEFPVY